MASFSAATKENPSRLLGSGRSLTVQASQQPPATLGSPSQASHDLAIPTPVTIAMKPEELYYDAKPEQALCSDTMDTVADSLKQEDARKLMTQALQAEANIKQLRSSICEQRERNATTLLSLCKEKQVANKIRSKLEAIQEHIIDV
jgi:hypothetical protein